MTTINLKDFYYWYTQDQLMKGGFLLSANEQRRLRASAGSRAAGAL